MIFRRIQIDGFGIWRNLDLEQLAPGLNVFVAPNEGGKTTLMAFVRSVLFGFRRRSDPQRYEPLRGGKHGGHIDIEANGTSFRLTRSDDGTSPGCLQITAEDGSALPEGLLAQLLHNTNDVLFENVFAFGLNELQKIDSLQKDEVAGHIYSAGMASSGNDPIGFRQQLQTELSRLYLPRGRKQTIPLLLAEIHEHQRCIEPLQQLPEEHAALLRQGEELRQRLAELDLLLAEKKVQLDAGHRAQRAWRDYEDLLDAEEKLAALGVPSERVGEGAPGDKEGGDPGSPSATAETAGTPTAHADDTDLLAPSQRALLLEAGRIRSLLAAAPRLRELKAAVQKHGAEADSANAVLATHLQDLGEGWNLERIRRTGTGHEIREAARQHDELMHLATVDIEAIAARAGDAHDAYEKAVRRHDPISREAVMMTWGVAAALTFVSAVVAPTAARVVTTAAVAAGGAVSGIIMLWLRRRGRLQLHEDRLAAAERETTLWSQHRAAEEELGKVLKQWKAWLEEQALKIDLTVDGTLDLLDRVREAQEVERQGREASRAAEKASEELAVACERVNALFESLGREGLPLDDTASAVEPFLGHLEALQADLEAADDHRLRLRTVMDQYAQAQAALRAVAGEEGAAALRQRLETLDPDQIERQVAEAEIAVAAVEAQRDGVNEQLGGISERISYLEGNDELAELLQAREQKRASLLAAIEEWAGYAVTAALFDQAKQVYEKERQPEVLRLASGYFKAMTGGRYGRVQAPLGEARLEVEESKGGKRKGPEALSRGTSEQLYLAMRLALAAVYAEEAVALPLVADDILVNFDDRRAEGTAALLGSYAAEGNQVLAFTCHSHLADVFAAQAPAARIVRLPSPRS